MNDRTPLVPSPGTEPVQAVYNALAPDYDRRWRRYIDLSLDKVMAVLSLRGDERVLDVACGTGELERCLFATWPGLHVTAIDLSPQMLRQARAKRIGGDVTWIEGQASALPVANHEFDLVVCANSFHYFRQPDLCLREFRRCLVPTGRLVLVDWCDDYVMCKVCSIWLRWADPAFYSTYTAHACHAMLRHTGFDILYAEKFKVSWLWGMMLMVASPHSA